MDWITRRFLLVVMIMCMFSQSALRLSVESKLTR